MAHAHALALRLDCQPTAAGFPDLATTLQLTTAALEAGLPGMVQPGRWTDDLHYEAVFQRPSDAIHVLHGPQTAARGISMFAGLAAGDHWSDVIRVAGRDVAPHALTVARALRERLDRQLPACMAVQGYGPWDQVASAALSLTCNMRSTHTAQQRRTEQAWRRHGHVGLAAKELRISRRWPPPISSR